MQTERCRVLYLDEDAENSFKLDTLLKLSACDPVTVNFASDALRLAENERFDLFIFSRRFPTGARLYLSRKLQEIAPQTPVLFLSEIAELRERGSPLYGTRKSFNT
jgi:DNA-binding NtrC family response regulator